MLTCRQCLRQMRNWVHSSCDWTREVGHVLGCVTALPSACVPWRLFYTGVYLTCCALGSQLPLWPRFIRVGMVLYVWLIALHEWKCALVCEKSTAPHRTCSGVIFEGFWEVVWFVQQLFWGTLKPRRPMHSVRKDTWNHSQGIKLNFKA